MADEHVLLPRERYQRLLNKAEPRKDSSDERKLVKREVEPLGKKKLVKREVEVSGKRKLVKREVVDNIKKTEQNENGSKRKREDRPPGIPISSNFKNWIRF